MLAVAGNCVAFHSPTVVFSLEGPQGPFQWPGVKFPDGAPTPVTEPGPVEAAQGSSAAMTTAFCLCS